MSVDTPNSFVDYITLTENVAPTGNSSRGDELWENSSSILCLWTQFLINYIWTNAENKDREQRLAQPCPLNLKGHVTAELTEGKGQSQTVVKLVHYAENPSWKRP